MKKFSIGDRIIIARDMNPGHWDYTSRIHSGMTGTVVYSSDGGDRVGIQFDSYIHGHTCQNRCPNGYGWFMDAFNPCLSLEEPSFNTDGFAGLI